MEESDRLRFDNGSVMHISQIEQSFGDWLKEILDFSRLLKSIDIDLNAFACVCALTLVHGQ